ncbi:hypothetical protein GCM10028828_17610 [Corynebacterium tapiri]
MPAGADPHSYEPSLRDVRAVANADVVLANHLLLEDQSVMNTVNEASLDTAHVVKVAETAERYGASLIPLVEDVTLDTPWLGARVIGDIPAGERAVDLVFTDVSGPGDMSAFLTGTFGQPQPYVNTADGLDSRDLIRLPPNAHTHMSWSFTKPGRYEATVEARVGDRVVAHDVVRFAVGVEPGEASIREGHVDVAADLEANQVGVRTDDGKLVHDVIEVPARALQNIPNEPAYRFMGRPGTEVYILPQAVLGKHVHGEIDPHAWHDMRNAKAYVQVIRDELMSADPAGAEEYRRNAQDYLNRIDAVDAQVTHTIYEIPRERRQLVTTHDGYAYLGKAYELNVAGFVSPNPAVEPSARDVVALTRTLEGLKVPAVFLEPSEASRPGTLKEIADQLGVRVCTIHGDTLGPDVPTYLDLMTTNANELKECLS